MLRSFELTGIRRRREIPQIGHFSDIDANGVCTSPRTRGTGKENYDPNPGRLGPVKKTLTMIKDAEAHAEDRKRRRKADVRNQAETLVYQTEKFVKGAA